MKDSTYQRRLELHAKPDCFTKEQWADWQHWTTYRPNQVDYACLDCTPDYQKRMLACGKCNWPCVDFFMMSDGTMEGRRTSIKTDRGYTEGRRIIRIRNEGARTEESDCSMGQDPALDSTG